MPRERLEIAAADVINSVTDKRGKTARMILIESRIVEKLLPFLSGAGAVSNVELEEALKPYAPVSFRHPPGTELLEAVRSLVSKYQAEQEQVRVERQRNSEQWQWLTDAWDQNRDLASQLRSRATKIDWDELQDLSPQELATWVKVGSRLQAQGRDAEEAVRDAVKWVEGNRPALPR